MLHPFYQGKRVLVTGHTGFKGSWLSFLLHELGADVTGYALPPDPEESLFRIAGLDKDIHSVTGDIRDPEPLKKVFDSFRPEIVFHLAAQPLVRESYRNPVDTYSTNVMGTVHLLECIRQCPSVRSAVNVTTDKVYRNREREKGYREDEELNGFDPYSNSKSCSELVTASYRNCFLAENRVAVSTVRAGNVIGGGDFAADRIVPDCIRAARAGKNIVLRNPESVRPYQHVLDSLYAYLLIAVKQYSDLRLAGAYNAGPEEEGCCTTRRLAELFIQAWGGSLSLEVRNDGGPHEANFLKLDCSKLKETFRWQPLFTLEQAVGMTAEWTKCYLAGNGVRACMKDQIKRGIPL